MVNIKVLGSGFDNYKQLEVNTRKVVYDLKLEAEIEIVTNMNDIMKWPIISTPGLVINNKVFSSGRIPGETEITAWLNEA